MNNHREKICYILPKYDENMNEHYFHILRLLEEIGKYIDVSLIIEKSSGIPRITNVREIYPQRFGYSSKLLRLIEMMYLTVKMRQKGYGKFFVRTSQTAAIPISLVTKILGGEVYLWRSGQGKEMLPKWSFNKGIIKDKLFNELAFKAAIKLVDRFVTGPESMAGYFEREWNVNPDKIIILYNDVDITRFDCLDDSLRRGRLKERLDLPLNKKIILMVHRLSHIRKTLNYLPKAIIDATNKFDDVFFLLVGDGTERAELERQILNSGVNDHVMMTGSLPNRIIHEYYSIADVFIMPSYCEGFPRVIIEAMASGIPFVATDAGGMLDLATDGQKRFVVPKNDVNAFSAGLLELIADADLRVRLGKENREHVKKYSVENVANMYIEKLFPVSILPLEGNSNKYIKKLVELDRYYIKEMGDAYSHQAWGYQHFSKELPGKKEYSRIAVNGKKDIAGFWIVSLTDEKSLHTHRVAVAKGYRGRRLAQRMFDEIATQARVNGISEMTVGVSASNEEAIKLYTNLGFHRLGNEFLSSFLEKKRRSATLYGDCIEDGGIKYCIFSKTL